MSTRFSARDPDFAERVSTSFARQSLMETFGATLELVEPGAVDIGMPHSARFAQQHGFLHAGAVAAIADSANGYAALTLTLPGQDVLAVEFKINLLRPARAPRLLARGRVLRPGRTLTVCAAEVVGIGGSGEELVASMLSTIITRPGS